MNYLLTIVVFIIVVASFVLEFSDSAKPLRDLYIRTARASAVALAFSFVVCGIYFYYLINSTGGFLNQDVVIEALGNAVQTGIQKTGADATNKAINTIKSTADTVGDSISKLSKTMTNIGEDLSDVGNNISSIGD